jgi:hypothetical protein
MIFGVTMWENLSRQQIGKFAEYLVKMELTSYGLDVYTTEVDDKGIDCIIRLNENKYIDIQIKSRRGYKDVYFPKGKFEISDNLYAIVVLFITKECLYKMFMIPSTVWKTPNKVFVSRDYAKPGQKSVPEWGINISRKSLKDLEKYDLKSVVETLRVKT